MGSFTPILLIDLAKKQQEHSQILPKVDSFKTNITRGHWWTAFEQGEFNQVFQWVNDGELKLSSEDPSGNPLLQEIFEAGANEVLMAFMLSNQVNPSTRNSQNETLWAMASTPEFLSNPKNPRGRSFLYQLVYVLHYNHLSKKNMGLPDFVLQLTCCNPLFRKKKCISLQIQKYPLEEMF